MELISAEYAALNAQLHRESTAYGSGGARFAAPVLDLVKRLNTRSVLDYGCGKGLLAKALPFPICEYDPAIKGKAELPEPADIVVCTDVLEHIEPDKLASVLADLRRCVKKVGYFVIATKPSTKMLSDGRNPHLIQRTEAWWELRLKEFFTVGSISDNGGLIYAVVGPKR